MVEKTYKLESKVGYCWRMELVVRDGGAVINYSNILAEYAGSYAEEDHLSDEESVAINVLESMVIALVATGIDGFEDNIIAAVDTTLNEIINRYGP
jgi:hypothetical protein